MARRSIKLLRFENTLYKYDNINQSWSIDNLKKASDDDFFDTGTHATCKHMSQKVTPTKLRRGYLDTWSTDTFVNYNNKTNNLKNIFYFQEFSKRYLSSVLKNLNVFFEKIEVKKVGGIFYINVFYFEPRLTSRRDLIISENRLNRFKCKNLIVKKEDNSIVNPFFL
jgi:hypothetical protein